MKFVVALLLLLMSCCCMQQQQQQQQRIVHCEASMTREELRYTLINQKSAAFLAALYCRFGL